ncbi:MAG: IMP cyclohydrolase [Christensenellales bacterium]|jgi:IMP cyclohydrolase
MYQNKRYELPELLKANAYPGRGILMGMTPDGRILAGYFIMGRSQNSRNRVFIREGKELLIRPYDEALVADPSLIIYRPVREYGDQLIVTNGDQTDTIYEALSQGGSFESALRKRMFEPDAPNFTPRISGLMNINNGDFKLSILRASDARGSACDRLFYEYAALPGLGRFIHTYQADGNPLPSFYGEPAQVNIPDDVDAFGDAIWQALHPDNKIALYLRVADQVTLFNRY